MDIYLPLQLELKGCVCHYAQLPLVLLFLRFHYVSQAEPKLKIPLPQPPGCWDNRHMLPQVAHGILL